MSSVTERINQEMHYQFDGNPPTMVFHIHKVSNTFVDIIDVLEEIKNNILSYNFK